MAAAGDNMDLAYTRCGERDEVGVSTVGALQRVPAAFGASQGAIEVEEEQLGSKSFVKGKVRTGLKRGCEEARDRIMLAAQPGSPCRITLTSPSP